MIDKKTSDNVVKLVNEYTQAVKENVEATLAFIEAKAEYTLQPQCQFLKNQEARDAYINKHLVEDGILEDQMKASANVDISSMKMKVLLATLPTNHE